jgi:hypothetical protein
VDDRHTAIWLPKWAGFSRWGFLLGRDCCVLTWNENVRYKLLTSGQINKTKQRGERGLLVAQERRCVFMRWRLEALLRLFPSSVAIGRWVAQARPRRPPRPRPARRE